MPRVNLYWLCVWLYPLTPWDSLLRANRNCYIPYWANIETQFGTRALRLLHSIGKFFDELSLRVWVVEIGGQAQQGDLGRSGNQGKCYLYHQDPSKIHLSWVKAQTLTCPLMQDPLGWKCGPCTGPPTLWWNSTFSLL